MCHLDCLNCCRGSKWLEWPMRECKSYSPIRRTVCLPPSHPHHVVPHVLQAAYHYSAQSSTQSNSPSHSPPPISFNHLHNVHHQFTDQNNNGQSHLDYHPEQDTEQEQEQALDEEPLYVNAKQYHRILKRRAARARLEELGRLSRQRKVRSLILKSHLFIYLSISSHTCTSPGISTQ